MIIRRFDSNRSRRFDSNGNFRFTGLYHFHKNETNSHNDLERCTYRISLQQMRQFHYSLEKQSTATVNKHVLLFLHSYRLHAPQRDFYFKTSAVRQLQCRSPSVQNSYRSMLSYTHKCQQLTHLIDQCIVQSDKPHNHHAVAHN